MIPATKLDALIARHAAIERELSGRPDRESYVRLSREFAELNPLVDAIKSYLAAADELSGLQSLIADPATEPDMRALAEQEKSELAARHEDLERQIRVALTPRDAADEHNRDVDDQRPQRSQRAQAQSGPPRPRSETSLPVQSTRRLWRRERSEARSVRWSRS